MVAGNHRWVKGRECASIGANRALRLAGYELEALCSLILCKITVSLDLREIRLGRYHHYVPKRPCSLAGLLRHRLQAL
jgi:hypothetical protein